MGTSVWFCYEPLSGGSNKRPPDRLNKTADRNQQIDIAEFKLMDAVEGINPTGVSAAIAFATHHPRRERPETFTDDLFETVETGFGSILDD